MDSRLYWIWLQQALPLACSTIGDLLDTFGDAAGVFAADESMLTAAGVRGDLHRRLADKSLDTAYRILDRVLQQGDWVLTPEDALYPVSLRHITGFPAALYCRGVMPDLDSTPAVTVVGTRRASQTGCQEARALSAGLAAGGMVVVSGGAVGIDRASHMGALEGGGITIAVMACPVDENYPVPNTDLRRQIVADGGLLISEYPSGEPYKCNYQVRNRLMVGLGHCVCLAQTPTRSGARITARLAREQGRDVYAMPGALSGHLYDGAHMEIQKGATLVIRATDILRDYAPLFPGMIDLQAAEEAQRAAEHRPLPKEKPKAAKKPRRKKAEKIETASTASMPPLAPNACPAEASETAKRVFDALTADPQPVDTLGEVTALPMAQLLAALTELELFGCAANSAGGQYRRL